MKALLMLLIAIFPAAGLVNAQDQDRSRDRDQIHLYQHLMMRDGQMYMIKNQVRTRLKEQLTLQNGAIVNPNGTYRFKNGKQIQLRNGECLGMDGARYRSQERFMKKMEKQQMKGMEKKKGMREDAGMRRMKPQNQGGKGRRN